MAPSVTRRWLVQLQWVAAVSAIAAACRQGRTAEERGTQATLPCPGHGFRIGADSNIPLAEHTDEMPERHDCQRFIEADGSYGPLMAIWASDELATAFALSAADPAPPPPADSSSDAVAITAEPWTPVAVIHNAGDKTYSPLQIKPGFNCLYMRRFSSQPLEWDARMVSHDKDPKQCKGDANLADEHGVAPPLTVRLELGISPADVPAVARWDREPQADGVYYIGIQCGNHWCEVGQPAGVRSSVRAIDDAPGKAYLKAYKPVDGVLVSAQEMRRVVTSKGWYDQQLLAAPTMPLRLGSVTGTIIPHPAVHKLKDNPAAFNGRWIASAYVHVTGDYEGKVRLEKDMNELHLCRDTADAPCPDVTPAMRADAKCGGSWWGQIVRPRSGREIRCVKYGGDNPVIPAGAARWRWMEDDETTWVRCGSGCCSNV